MALEAGPEPAGDAGRPLRVLHIGNIANNAYNNAKIQRAAGIEADVLCYDYFHVMGCPEWEDADFVGDVGDPFFPDWWRVDLNGYVRPPWFVQGRGEPARRYLLALRSGHERRARRAWRRLQWERWLRCRSTRQARVLREVANTARMAALPPEARGARLGELPAEEQERVRRGERRPIEGVWSATRLYRRLRLALSWLRFGLLLRLRVLLHRVRLAVATLVRKVGQSVVALALLLRGTPWREAALTVFPRRLASLARTARERELTAAAVRAAQGATTGIDVPAVTSLAAHAVGDVTPPVGTGEGPLEALWARLYPDREPLTPTDYASYVPQLDEWRRLLEHYDVVQAYSTDPIIPVLAGFERFVAYEHGTLREIPFEETPRGRTCALAYRLAPTVFVTNLDVLPSVERLGIEDDHVVCLPHAVDSGKLLRFGAANAGLRPPGEGPPVVFSPSRQDWVTEDPSWSKGNDRLLRATRAVLDAGHDVRLVLVAWGRDLAASRALVDELGLTAAVEWVEPLKKRLLWARYLESHAVVDQFVLGAIGGVAFEALAFGKRVITALDVPAATRFFGEPPPVLVASTVEEVTARLHQVVADRDDAAGLGDASRAWFARYHSAERVVQLQLDAYARLVPGLEAAGDGRVHGHTS